MKYDVIIVGAGASGLVSAIVLARRGKKVLIVEKNSKVGKKLLATGNGKCNITNQRPTPERYYSQNPPFISKVLKGYGYQEIKQFFKSIGLELVEAKEGKLFPLSLQATSVVELLAYECEKLGVKIICNTEVKSLDNLTKKYKKVLHTKGEESSLSIIIATGNLSAPQLGGSNSGMRFAKEVSHKLIDTFPTLVQLTSEQSGLKNLSGVKVYSRVKLITKSKRIVQKEGDVLFTSYGISGLAILDISRFVMEELKHQREVTLEIDLMPKMTQEQLFALMKKSLIKKSPKPLSIWLQGFIHKKLIPPILEPLKLERESLGSLSSNRKMVEKIIEKIKRFTVTVNGSRGYKGAEVATGGVDTREINPLTMESKKQQGLYFTGEVLDVDGDRGGFNLHFAWVCGLRAGEGIAKG